MMKIGERITAYLSHRRHQEFLSFLAILGIAIAFRLINLSTKGLWYDEIQSVTHAILPLKDLVKSVLAFDPHPPLYYLQLHFWMWFGTSDLWIKLNSVLWSIATLVMVYLIGRAFFNPQVALLGSSFFALSPFAILYAQEARMYSMLMFLGASSFYFFRRYVDRQKWEYILSAVFCAAFFLYSHGSGFLILVSLGGFAVWYLLESRFSQWKITLSLFVALLVLVVISIPWLQIASSISVGHAVKPDLDQVAETIFTILGGFATYPLWLKWIVAVLFSAGILLSSMKQQNSRSIVVAFGFVPVLFCVLVSYWYRPIWLDRTIAYLSPFWSLLIACCVQAIKQEIKLIGYQLKSAQLRQLLVFVTIALLIFAAIFQQLTFSFPWNFKGAAQFLDRVAQKGDIIYVPHDRVFWGMGWYLAGPGSVTPLTTNFSLATASGVQVLSRPSLGELLDNQTYWLVYRPLDDTAPFFGSFSSGPNWVFNDLKIVQVRR